MSDSLRPHRQQPTRLPRPWDSPGKNTEVGCHFLLQCMKVKSEREVAQPCPTPSDPMDCCPPGSSIHGSFQAKELEWGAIAFSKAWDYLLLICRKCVLVRYTHTYTYNRYTNIYQNYTRKSWGIHVYQSTFPEFPWAILIYKLSFKRVLHRKITFCYM